VRSVAAGLGLREILWDVDPFDWKIPGSSYVSWHILRYTNDGDIILLHDTAGPSTYNAIGDIVTGLRERGLEFVTLCR
jgi:peptidoglycan/xylan/chitin deacetylase (PgdA/CDA1 family)